MAFIGIHNHFSSGSNLRLRDTTNKVDEVLKYSHDLGHKGIVITDHESISAHLEVMKFYDTVKEEWGGFDGYRIGYGNEIYLCPSWVTAENAKNNIYPHFILIALDEIGHKGLRELSTKAWINNSFMNVMMRVPTYYSDLEVFNL